MPKPPEIRKRKTAASSRPEKRVDITINLDVAPAIKAFMSGLAAVIFATFLLMHPDSAGSGAGKVVSALASSLLHRQL